MLTDRHIAKLWERMAMIYGHRWTSSYGDKDDGTWLAGLADVAPEQIGAGLEKCRTNGQPWPPTLPEFRAMCLPDKAPAYHRPALTEQAPPKEVRVAQVDKHMPGIRQMLGAECSTLNESAL